MFVVVADVASGDDAVEGSEEGSEEEGGGGDAIVPVRVCVCV